MKNVILYRAHHISQKVLDEVARLKAELDGVDVVIVGYLEETVAGGETEGTIIYDKADVCALPYPVKLSDVPWPSTIGHNDLPVLKFFLENPKYDYYWLVEYDVRYTGDWSLIFDDLMLSSADLLATSIVDNAQQPDWHWWPSLKIPNDLETAPQMVRSFLPFCRISNALLRELDIQHKAGWSGHYELVWPTVARAFGYSIEDIGGQSAYTPEHRMGQHYMSNPDNPNLFPGTFLFRPSFVGGDIEQWGKAVVGDIPMLWHPVRD
jgi:hypothetical protein